MPLLNLSLLSKFILGITLAAPLGPVSIEMIQRGLSRVFLSSFSIRLGGVIGNTLCLILSLMGLTSLLQFPWALNILGLMGGLVLCHMGIQSWRKSFRPIQRESSQSLDNGILLGFYLSLANPVALVFWLGIFAADLESEASFSLDTLLPELMILVGVLCWGAGLASIASLGRQWLSPRRLILVTRLSSALLVCFGLKYMWAVLEKIFF